MRLFFRRSPDFDTSGAPAAAVAVPVAAPAAAPAAPEPQSPLQEAMAAARARLTESGSVLPPDAPTQDRRPDGTFLPTGIPGTQAAGAEPDAASAPTEPETPSAETAVADAPGVVVLPAMRDGESALEIELEDPVAAERLRQITNSIERRAVSEHRLQESRSLRSDVDDFMDIAAVDPGGLVLDAMPPEHHVHMARFLLTRPHVWEALRDEVLGYEHPEAVERARHAVDDERDQLLQVAEQQLTTRRAKRENAREIQRVVSQLTPASLSEEAAHAFQSEALEEARQYVLQHKVDKLDARFVPLVIERVLQKYHLDPAAAIQALRSGVQTPPTPPKRVRGRPAAARDTRPPTGRQLVDSAAKRQRAAQVPGPSAGGIPATRIVPPPKQTTAQRIEWLRGQMRGNNPNGVTLR